MKLKSFGKYPEFFNGNSINREQLYGELRFHHAIRWVPFLKDNANPANIHILSDGSVKDHRWYVRFASSLYEGGYD